MTRTKATRAHRPSQDHAGAIPVAELFAHPGEQVVVERALPLTPGEQFRERVAAAWAWVKAVWFHEYEHERLGRVLVKRIAQDRL